MVEPVNKSICFSAEKADTATIKTNGIDNVLEMMGLDLPSVYSSELSEFVSTAVVGVSWRHA
ncbi:hypothetical protein [Paenarthrobacter sp. PH39-S1]|uniref:hypothetical protein n=1 Tax=Paenarthrobacter sp. PH39-S1 TaxID=3046204 RepID=UPI0024B9098A|nr:hypothetical protein [Paenarthrobacter sp. PH39-S1]MDJ0356811.1 hypothetical protein [Paenarthrobacter sp. PH39-S1]